MQRCILYKSRHSPIARENRNMESIIDGAEKLRVESDDDDDDDDSDTGSESNSKIAPLVCKASKDEDTLWNSTKGECTDTPVADVAREALLNTIIDSLEASQPKTADTPPSVVKVVGEYGQKVLVATMDIPAGVNFLVEKATLVSVVGDLCVRCARPASMDWRNPKTIPEDESDEDRAVHQAPTFCERVCSAAKYCSEECRDAHASIHLLMCPAAGIRPKCSHLRIPRAKKYTPELLPVVRDASDALAHLASMVALAIKYGSANPETQAMHASLHTNTRAVGLVPERNRRCHTNSYLVPEDEFKLALELTTASALALMSALDATCYGYGIFEQAGAAQHACLPNCVVNFAGTRAMMCSIAPISKGDVITTNYAGILLPAILDQKTRHDGISNRLARECTCAACDGSGEEIPIYNPQDLTGEIKNAFEEACTTVQKIKEVARLPPQTLVGVMMELGKQHPEIMCDEIREMTGLEVRNKVDLFALNARIKFINIVAGNNLAEANTGYMWMLLLGYKEAISAGLYSQAMAIIDQLRLALDNVRAEIEARGGTQSALLARYLCVLNGARNELQVTHYQCMVLAKHKDGTFTANTPDTVENPTFSDHLAYALSPEEMAETALAIAQNYGNASPLAWPLAAGDTSIAFTPFFAVLKSMRELEKKVDEQDEGGGSV